MLSLAILLAISFNSSLSEPALAVILYGTGDPTANTTAPTGALADSGWQFVGLWGGVTGTPIAPNYFIAARHVGGSIGDSIRYKGTNYTTIAVYDSTNSDLRIWKIAGTFPSYAPLYTNSNEMSKAMVVMGRGTERGEEVFLETASFAYVTNKVNWKSLGLSRKQIKKKFPNAVIKGQFLIFVSMIPNGTNLVSRGWKFGPSDGALRWGVNRVVGIGTFLVGSFDPTIGANACYLSFGDSSGPTFIQDSDKVWKLAGVNYGIDDQIEIATAPCFYAALTDKTGFYGCESTVPYADIGQANPTIFYCSRISASIDWITSVIRNP